MYIIYILFYLSGETVQNSVRNTVCSARQGEKIKRSTGRNIIFRFKINTIYIILEINFNQQF